MIVDPLLLPGGVCGGVDGTFDDLFGRKNEKIVIKFTKTGKINRMNTVRVGRAMAVYWVD